MCSDVTSDGDIIVNTSMGFNSTAYLLDNNPSTAFSPFTEYENLNDQPPLFGPSTTAILDADLPVIVELELPEIIFTDSHSSFWDISQIQIHWNFYSNNSMNYSDDYITFTVETKLEEEQNWIDQTSSHQHGHYEYAAASYTKLDDIQSLNMLLNETRFIRLTFSNASAWSDAFEIAEIKLLGAAPRNKIVCDRVQFHPWLFDASASVTDECPSITPVFANMYRGFVRKWINAQLLEAHKPFILGLNIRESNH